MDERETKNLDLQIKRVENLLFSGKLGEAIVAIDEILRIDPWNLYALDSKLNAMVALRGNESVIKYLKGKVGVLYSEQLEDIEKMYEDDNRENEEKYERQRQEAIEDGLIEDNSYEPGDDDKEDDIVNECDQILIKDPKNIQALYDKSKRLHELNRHREAFDAYDQIIKVNTGYINQEILTKDLLSNK